MDETNTPRPALQEGTLHQLRVAEIGESSIAFDSVDGRAINALAEEFLTPPQVGAELTVFVDKEGGSVVQVSERKASLFNAWEWLQTRAEAKEQLDGEVIGPVKGGFAIKIEVPGLEHGVRGFFPGTQVDPRPLPPQAFSDQKYQFRIARLGKKKFDLVLERKEEFAAEQKRLAEETLSRLNEGDIVQGVVRRFLDYGAFVDIGGVDALLHSNDMSWTKGLSPRQVLKENQELSAKVVSIDSEKKKIGISLKHLMPDPWEGIAEKFPTGSEVQGRVSSLVDYGAFVELSPGIEGLLHVSELVWTNPPKHPSARLSVGDEVVTKIIDLDSDARRLSLSLRQMQENPWDSFAKAHPLGTKVKGPVVGTTEFGIFVRVADNEDRIDGLIHYSDISWDKRSWDAASLAEAFPKGTEVEAVIRDLSPERQRLALSIKALGDNPWQTLAEQSPRGTLLSGEVLSTNSKGAEIKLNESIVAFCPRKELSSTPIDRVEDVITKGQTIDVVIIKTDVHAQRCLVSVKAVHDGLDEDIESYNQRADEQFSSTLGDLLKGAVKSE